MRFVIGFGCAIVPVLLFLVDPAPQAVESVDTISTCVRKHWRGKPIEQWAETPDMDAVCRSILRLAREANR
jgi:hypothetical protein